MSNQNVKHLVELVADTLVRAGSTFSEDKKAAYRRAIEAESNDAARWVMETILQNAEVAEKLTALRAQIEKKNSAERKPTKKQDRNSRLQVNC